MRTQNPSSPVTLMTLPAFARVFYVLIGTNHQAANNCSNNHHRPAIDEYGTAASQQLHQHVIHGTIPLLLGVCRPSKQFVSKYAKQDWSNSTIDMIHPRAWTRYTIDDDRNIGRPQRHIVPSPLPRSHPSTHSPTRLYLSLGCIVVGRLSELWWKEMPIKSITDWLDS